jgi:hypothetical protein
MQRNDQAQSRPGGQDQDRARAGVLDRLVVGAAYLVQWVRARLTSRHAGRS